MPNKRGYQIYDNDADSFDDLDTSLDKALNSATHNYFNNANGGSRQASHGGSIPLADLHSLSETETPDPLSNDSDSSPLISQNRLGLNNSHNNSNNNILPYSNHTRSFSSTSSLNLTARSITSRSKRFIQKSINLFKLAKQELSQERLRVILQEEEENTSDSPNVLSTSDELNNERYISPRNTSATYPSNAISNAKYNPITFLPIILYEQFKFFFNLYFLIVALSQIIPQLRIGYLSSYIVPLAFVLTVTMMKEAGDDLSRRRRDKDQNNELYEVLNRTTSPLTQDVKLICSKDLKVGDLVRLHKDTRVPADMIIVQSSDRNGEAFIKTDQLDGETDWKLRIAQNVTQSMQSINGLINNISLIISNPTKSIDQFNGKLIYHQQNGINETFPLTIDQTLWANTVLASGTAIGIVVYTGIETRQSMNTTKLGVKTGLLEIEINKISKILCIFVFILSVVLVLVNGFPLKSTWYIDILRFLILFSSIIPVSLRVNLDLAKSVYASQIHKDDEIPETIVRTSTIPEDLGRIEYLLSDKTGTLTQNDMELKKLHLGTVSYAGETIDMVSDYVKNIFNDGIGGNISTNFKKKDLSFRVNDLILTLALCHNVTPTEEEVIDDNNQQVSQITYQAASPDEIAIVKFTESVGLKLIKRDRKSISLLHLYTGVTKTFEIRYNFPFNSDTKRMGIIIKDNQSGEIWFMEKGADTVMNTIVNNNDWLDEETSNMAREGLRTLVIGRKKLSNSLYQDFVTKYGEASISMHDRENLMQRVINNYLEQDVELLGLTGVEDKLQVNVKTSIELLRNAGIKIWMLTGDKVETAKCVSISARLISRGQYVHTITKIGHSELAINQLDFLKNSNLNNTCLLIDGESLSIYMKYFKYEFFQIAIKLPAVIACRCTPQQKADVALIIKEITGKRICCIGDGGNDVSMIQCADVGVGIVGKEGKQASLSADFSINQFSYLLKLLLWHGRNSYKRSAKLGQFIIHRGLIISIAQVIYSISSNFEPIALYQGFLMVGYSTIYTMAPVFSLTLDCDIDEHLTKLYPELYKELTLGKSLSYKSFLVWVVISIYQGCVIQLLSQKFQTIKIENFLTMVTISFSCLIFNELFMVALQINKWNKIMIITILSTFLIYIGSIPFLKDYFNLGYISSFSFIWQSIVILLLSLFPVWITQAIRRKLKPPSYAKVQQD